MAEVKMTEELRQKMAGLLPFDKDATIEYTPPHYYSPDFPEEYRPVFTQRGYKEGEINVVRNLLGRLDKATDQEMSEQASITIVKWENLWGLGSGVMASWAMIALNLARRHNDSQTILFIMFGLGALIIYVLYHDAIFWPNRLEFIYLFCCSAAGVLGQYLLTYGFLYVTAVEGSIISSSRIIMAAILGPLLVADPPLTIAGWCGALLIFGANSALAFRKSRPRSL
jgi:hypothetical protein